MLDPRPALADGVDDQLCPGAVGYVGRRQVDLQQAAVGVHRHVPLAADGLLGSVVAPPGTRCRRLDRLAVDHAGREAGLASGSLSFHHQGDVVDLLEKHHRTEQFIHEVITMSPSSRQRP